MKNDNYSVSPNKKSYAFKPKNSKIKRNEFDTVLNNILKKSKGVIKICWFIFFI